MRKYEVFVYDDQRTFQKFTDKAEAISYARSWFDLGYNDVRICYSNGNQVPNTPVYAETERRTLKKPYTIILMDKRSGANVAEFKADEIRAIRDKNHIDCNFYREFWCNGCMVGRYRSEEFYFDFGRDFWED